LQQDGVRVNQVTQVRGYADQMLRVKNNPTDPSNRRISILVKNVNEEVPDFDAASVVNGKTPLTSDEKTPAPTTSGAKPEGTKPEATKPGSAPAAPSAKPGGAPQAAPPTPAPAAKPPAPAPAPKPGMMDKLKAMLPGKKK
jgi:chemotaxis protein MotB